MSSTLVFQENSLHIFFAYPWKIDKWCQVHLLFILSALPVHGWIIAFFHTKQTLYYFNPTNTKFLEVLGIDVSQNSWAVLLPLPRFMQGTMINITYN